MEVGGRGVTIYRHYYIWHRICGQGADSNSGPQCLPPPTEITTQLSSSGYSTVLVSTIGSTIKSSLSKSMQLSIPPIGRSLSFSTSHVYIKGLGYVNL